MKGFLRRLRGAMGLGLAWGFTWFSAGMLMFLAGARADVPFPLGFGFLGFLAGTVFGGALGLVEGRRRFDELSIPRFALLGGLGGAGFAAVFVVAAGVGLQNLAVVMPIFGLAGAACAAGTLAIARRAEDPALLESRDLADEVGLTDEERRELLGGD